MCLSARTVQYGHDVLGFAARPDSASAGRFATTHWSVIVAAQGPASPEAQKALAVLCATYWYPLYVYIRRQGYSVEQTEDLTQGFFAGLLEQHSLKGPAGDILGAVPRK